MLRKFISGIVFGLGLSISFVAVATIWLFWGLPSVTFSTNESTTISSSEFPGSGEDYPFIENFHELPLEEKIAKSTAILITEISETEEGVYENMVAEVLKKEDGVDMFYNVGEIFDEYEPYDESGDFVPSGFIVFMGGNPASMRYSVSYTGDRIRSLGGITLALLREKCDT